MPLLMTAALGLGTPAPAQDENPLLTLVRQRVPDPAKPFVLVVRFKAKSGQGPALEHAFAPAIEATLKEKGCQQYALTRDTAAPESLLLYEKWASVDDLAAHLKSPHIAQLMTDLADLTDGPPEGEVHLPVGG